LQLERRDSAARLHSRKNLVGFALMLLQILLVNGTRLLIAPLVFREMWIQQL
jgi:hypothetical protein